MEDFTGKHFNDWELLQFISISGGMQRYLARCVCGKQKIVILGNLKRGLSRGCGCVGKRKYSIPSDSPEYKTWRGMIDRCYNDRNRNYKDYGGRGIKVCDRWRESFENFYADMGKRQEGLTLDRINNNGNYEPSNCRWATSKQQAMNKRRKLSMLPEHIKSLDVSEERKRQIYWTEQGICYMSCTGKIYKNGLCQYHYEKQRDYSLWYNRDKKNIRI